MRSGSRQRRRRRWPRPRQPGRSAEALGADLSPLEQLRPGGPWRILALAALLAGALAACGSSSLAPAEPTPDEVLALERVFTDPTRSVPPNHGAPGSDVRPLATRLWIAPEAPRHTPACGGPRCALILLAHGFGGSTARFEKIGRALAAAGYVVAAPAFPLTNDQAPGGHLTGLGDAVEQPRDLSYVLDALIELPAGDLVGDRVDRTRIGAVGHSLGGATVLGATRRPCCRDERVIATALVAPVAALTQALFGGPPEVQGPPVLVLNGALDPLVTPALGRDLFARLGAPRVLVVLASGGHADLLEDFGPDHLLETTSRLLRAYFDRFLGGRPSPHTLAATLAELAAEGHEVASDLGSDASSY